MQYLLILVGIACLGVLYWQVHRRGLHRWLGAHLRQTPRRWGSRSQHPVHLLLCIADHYEPDNGNVPSAVARSRVQRWLEEYPRLFGHLRDSDGLPPRHTFFYPAETYNPDDIDMLADLCGRGFGEVEIHLHHDRDTAESFRAAIQTFKRLLAQRHGLLSRHRITGQLAYAFVHGNWALNNCHPDGQWCGVDNELEILRQTGCYADFTFPSAPYVTQPSKINSIYYVAADACSRAIDRGIDVGTAPPPLESLMLIQGPLLLNWRRRKWGLIPRMENACIQGNQPPDSHRIDLWLQARVQVPTRPDWFFVKLHTHGAPESNQRVLLGPAMLELHRDLARRAQQNANFHYHYVTAREMYNLVRAAEARWQGSVIAARDYELLWNAASRCTPHECVAAATRHSRGSPDPLLDA